MLFLLLFNILNKRDTSMLLNLKRTSFLYINWYASVQNLYDLKGMTLINTYNKAITTLVLNVKKKA